MPSFWWTNFSNYAIRLRSLIIGLLHELEHTKQSRAFDFSLTKFAHHYAYLFCQCGFSYRKHPMEVDAYNIELSMEQKMMPRSFGVDFFLVWRTFRLVENLGFPTEQGWHLDSEKGGEAQWIVGKSFQKGVLQLRERLSDGTHCYRFFRKSEIDAMHGSNAPVWNSTAERNYMERRNLDVKFGTRVNLSMQGVVDRVEEVGAYARRRRELPNASARNGLIAGRKPWICGLDVPFACGPGYPTPGGCVGRLVTPINSSGPT